ncbi:hypothetical protein MATL_G00134330 [Megalops atlanticus]|uniref:C2H2-type domain-containing protein n=1 Tax=Megalops atlanticus TaxID=7932 RepID=A0A9D3PX07_MEGAT|nr:hypothetical protein MATL_G00134330 [Megalops atlanticus]
MDKSTSKRKLRSGKEVGKDEPAHQVEGSDSKVVEGSAGGPPLAKRAKAADMASNIAGEQKNKERALAEAEVEAEKACSKEDESQPDKGGGQTAVEGRTCSLCDFVAKTPTALKVHATRKHSGEETHARKTETSKTLRQRRGSESERLGAPETNSADLIDEHVKEPHEEKQAISSTDGHLQFEDVSVCQADDLNNTQIQRENTAPGGQADNISSPKCQEAGDKELKKSEMDITGKMVEGQSSLMGDKGTAVTQAQMERDGGDCKTPTRSTKDTGTEGMNPVPKTKAKRDNRAASQTGTEGTSLSPTQILLEMVEVVEAESTCVEDSDRKQESKKGSVDSECGSEATGDSAAVEQGDSLSSDCQIVSDTGTAQVAEMVEGQEVPVCQKVVKRGPKPKTQHACSYCGHVFRDKPSLVMHVKRRHTKEMNFFCELCSYACVAKCDYEKHCSSNKHKKRVSEGGSITGDLPTAGGEEKPEDALKMVAQVSSKGSESVPASVAQLQCKVQGGHTDGDTCDDPTTTSDANEEEQKDDNVGECVQESAEEASTSQGQKSPGRELSSGDDPQRSEEDGSGLQPSDGAEQAVTTGTTGSAEELAEKSSPKKRRGRPKASTLTTCDYCGLVASNATNLSVHIRRRHSHEYGFVCKVCSYSCVTKGDMDRHCTTKKHIKRVAVTRADSSEDSQVDPTNVVEVLISKASATGAQPREGEVMEAGSGLSTESGTGPLSHLKNGQQTQTDAVQTESDDQVTGPAQKKCKYDSVNSCTYCGFVAHSIPSLDLHIKRKHTRDFEFVCMACNYYAVTCREMSRHATTDKHRQKSQAYLESLGNNEIDLTQLDSKRVAQSESQKM